MQRFEAPVGLSIARLSAPQPSPFHVARPRLIHLLDDAATLPLTLVTGGPGTGKTNAVTAWIRGGQVPGPVAWVTLDKTLDTPSRLWSAIIAALESSLGELTLGELQPPGTIEPAFIDVLRDRVGGHDVVLVLDDVHELGADALAGLDHFLRIPPAGMHTVLISRHVPVLALQRHRLAGRLGEVRAADLEFRREEIGDLVEAHGLMADDVLVDELLRVSGGWVAGLRLALLTMSGAPDPRKALAGFRGEQPMVAGYLTEELEHSLGAELFDVLTRTCVADRICGPLAVALTGDSSLVDTLRERLGEAPLVAELSDTGWFRYHPLLLQMLRARLRRIDPALMRELHARASDWFEGQGEWLTALDHAIASGDWSLAIRVALRSGTVELLHASTDLLGLTLDRIPDLGPAQHGPVLLIRAAAALGRHEYAAATSLVERAAPLLGGLDEPDRSVALLNTRMMESLLARAAGDAAAMTRAALDAVDLLAGLDAEDAPGWACHRGAPLSMVGLGHLWFGRPLAAVAALREADRADTRSPLSGYDDVWRTGNMALALAISGDITDAQTLAQAARALATELGGPTASETQTAWLASAILALQRGDTADLMRYLKAGQEAAARGHDPFTTAVLMLLRCRAAQHVGDPAGAARELARAADHLAAYPGLVYALRLWASVAALAELQVNRSVEGAQRILAEHDRREAVWAEAARAAGATGAAAPSEATALEVDPLRIVRAHVLLASGQPERVREVVADVVRRPATISVLAWIAIAFAEDQMRHDALATEAIGEAIELAHGAGLTTPFRNPSPRLQAILVRHREVDGRHADFVDALLEARDAQGTPAAPARPVEALTERELAVLAYLPTMRSNAEIADALDISVNTVKQHLKSVHRKLGVGSRREAVRMARQVGLLPEPAAAE